MTKDANPALSTSAGSTVYGSITFSIAANNARSGETISIELKGGNGSRISWSTGQEFSTSSGIELRASQGAVPISRLHVGSELIILSIAPSDTGGSTPFRLTVGLAATRGIKEFTLQMTAEAGSSVSATLERGRPTLLSDSSTIFNWGP